MVHVDAAEVKDENGTVTEVERPDGVLDRLVGEPRNGGDSERVQAEE